MTAVPRFTLQQLAEIAVALEDVGHVGIGARCEAVLETNPRLVTRILGAALKREGAALIANAAARALRH